MRNEKRSKSARFDGEHGIHVLRVWGCILVLAASLCACLGDPPAPDKMANGVYVWQQAWGPGVTDAVALAGTRCDVLMVLVAELDLKDGALVARTPNIDWASLAATKRSVVAVVRAHALPGIETEAGRVAAIDAIATQVDTALKQSQAAGIQLNGVQMDYDCATSKLGAYTDLMAALRNRYPAVAWSITALPTWLASDACKKLVAGLDHFVLQVHAFDAEALNRPEPTLCEVARVPTWVDAAGEFATPFYVALPTYGYRLVYDASGDFLGIRAEDESEMRVGVEEREVHADPVAMAQLVNGFAEQRSSNMRGVVWFRLPVADDSLNWSWALLAEVMAGRAPTVTLAAEVRPPEPGLHEVWLANSGNYRPTAPSRVYVVWNGTGQMAHDALGGFACVMAEGKSACTLEGRAPEPGKPVMIGWFRFAEKTTNVTVKLDEK